MTILDKIKQRIDLIEKEGVILVAIDGPCASGKTTLGKRLASELSATLIHADDFFLPKEKRTAERKAEVGGNIDYERLYDEVIAPLKRGGAFSYRKYDCHSGTFERESVTPKKVCIIEGSYSTHPYFNKPYDLTIFLEIDEIEQARRITEREQDNAINFFSLWIPKENAYFEKFCVKENCDLTLKQGEIK